jgi:transcriptional regulator with XRE-family HTH domain
VWIRPQDHRVVGECLAAVRSRAGITQRELAARLGKPQSFVSAYENGQRRIDVLEFLRIVGALNLNPRGVFSEIADRAVEIGASDSSNGR